MKKSKKYTAASALVENNKLYTKEEAIDLVNRIFYPYVLIVTEDEKLIAEAIKLYDNSANLKIFKNEDDISLNDIYTADLKLSTELITELTGFIDQLKPNELLWMSKSINDEVGII